MRAYRELPAPPALAPWVACAWELTEPPGEGERLHRVLPDGCMDLVVRDREGLQVAGPDTRAAMARVPAGGTAVGVRLRPGGAPALLGLPAPALRDARPPAAEVLGPWAARLGDALAGAPPGERAGILLGRLAARAPGAPEPDPLVAAVAAVLAPGRGPALPALARRLGLGERHLRRRVVEAVGYGPKRLARVLRMQRALAMARAEPGLGWAAVAQRAGYADQPHLVNDLRELAGATPTALLAAT